VDDAQRFGLALEALSVGPVSNDGWRILLTLSTPLNADPEPLRVRFARHPTVTVPKCVPAFSAVGSAHPGAQPEAPPERDDALSYVA
jgi:hypothetical protein